jgi:hypothetical protein
MIFYSIIQTNYCWYLWVDIRHCIDISSVGLLPCIDKSSINILYIYNFISFIINQGGRRGCDRMVFWFTATCSVQSLPISTNVVSWNPTHGEVYSVLDTNLCDKVCQHLAAGLWFSPGTPASSTSKADRHIINLNNL